MVVRLTALLPFGMVTCLVTMLVACGVGSWQGLGSWLFPACLSGLLMVSFIMQSELPLWGMGNNDDGCSLVFVRSLSVQDFHFSSALDCHLSRSCLVVTLGGQLFGIGQCRLHAGCCSAGSSVVCFGEVGVTGSWRSDGDDTYGRPRRCSPSAIFQPLHSLFLWTIMNLQAHPSILQETKITSCEIDILILKKLRQNSMHLLVMTSL